MNIDKIDIGAGLDKSFLTKFDGIPKCLSGGTYTFKDKVTDIGSCLLHLQPSQGKGPYAEGFRGLVSRRGDGMERGL